MAKFCRTVRLELRFFFFFSLLFSFSFSTAIDWVRRRQCQGRTRWNRLAFRGLGQVTLTLGLCSVGRLASFAEEIIGGFERTAIDRMPAPPLRPPRSMPRHASGFTHSIRGFFPFFTSEGFLSLSLSLSLSRACFFLMRRFLRGHTRLAHFVLHVVVFLFIVFFFVSFLFCFAMSLYVCRGFGLKSIQGSGWWITAPTFLEQSISTRDTVDPL